MSNLKFNVAQLLREQIGARRDHDFTEDTLAIDAGLTMRNLVGSVRFTRTPTGVFAQVKSRGTVRLMCVRSLEEFDHLVELDFSDQFHSLIDLMTGTSLPKPDEDDPYMLTEAHMADIGDAIREYTLLELPINPVSPAHRDTPVRYSIQSEGIEDEDVGEQGDARFEALKVWAEQQNKKNRS